jgi:hypothetical protein
VKKQKNWKILSNPPAITKNNHKNYEQMLQQNPKIFGQMTKFQREFAARTPSSGRSEGWDM